MEGEEEDVSQAKALKRTLRALQSSATPRTAAVQSSSSFVASLRHTSSGLLLAHSPVTPLRLVGSDTADEHTRFRFVPHTDVQMGRSMRGYRVQTALGYDFVAVLGRRCTARLVKTEDIPTPGTEQHRKFFIECTNIFEVDLAAGCFRYLHHSSADAKDTMFFPISTICEKRINDSDCERLKKGNPLGDNWKYLEIKVIEK